MMFMKNMHKDHQRVCPMTMILFCYPAGAALILAASKTMLQKMFCAVPFCLFSLFKTELSITLRFVFQLACNLISDGLVKHSALKTESIRTDHIDSRLSCQLLGFANSGGIRSLSMGILFLFNEPAV